VKASTEWFPAKERSVAIGWFNIGSSIGALCAPPWWCGPSCTAAGDVLRGGGRAGGDLVRPVDAVLQEPADQKLLSPEERAYILTARKNRPRRCSARAGRKIVRSRNFWSIAIPRFLSEPAWQTFNAWIPLYMATERHMNIKEIAMFAWLPFLAADIGCVLGGYLSPFFHKHLNVSLFTSRKLVMLVGSLAMIGPACVGFVDSPYVAIALLSIGGFAHQTLSGALYSITSDVFTKNRWPPPPA
jgi:ACS family hexuronate transporter-like MFS transporter